MLRVAVVSDTHAPRFWKTMPPAVGVLVLDAGRVVSAEIVPVTP